MAMLIGSGVRLPNVIFCILINIKLVRSRIAIFLEKYVDQKAVKTNATMMVTAGTIKQRANTIRRVVQHCLLQTDGNWL